MTENKEIELSVVVLCFRSEHLINEFVNQLVGELAALNTTYELLLVANYDSENDKTPEISYAIAKRIPNCKVIAKPKKGRMGWDMKSGLAESKGKYIAVIDGDGQMPVSDIPVVYKIISTGYFDLVKTFRTKRFDGFYRRIISKVYNILFGLIFNPDFPVRDINSKPKILTREALGQMKLLSNDWFTDAEIMLEANRLKLRICDAATIFYRNQRRSSHVGVGTIFEFIYNMLYYRIKMIRK